jgi:hypothetical protein
MLIEEARIHSASRWVRCQLSERQQLRPTGTLRGSRLRRHGAAARGYDCGAARHRKGFHPPKHGQYFDYHFEGFGLGAAAIEVSEVAKQPFSIGGSLRDQAIAETSQGTAWSLATESHGAGLRSGYNGQLKSGYRVGLFPRLIHRALSTTHAAVPPILPAVRATRLTARMSKLFCVVPVGNEILCVLRVAKRYLYQFLWGHVVGQPCLAALPFAARWNLP